MTFTEDDRASGHRALLSARVLNRAILENTRSEFKNSKLEAISTHTFLFHLCPQAIIYGLVAPFGVALVRATSTTSAAAAGSTLELTPSAASRGGVGGVGSTSGQAALLFLVSDPPAIIALALEFGHGGGRGVRVVHGLEGSVERGAGDGYVAPHLGGG